MELLLASFKPEGLARSQTIAVLYPKPKIKIYIPIEIGGKLGRTVFEAAHLNINTTFYCIGL